MSAHGLARIHHITFDCREPYALAQFWAAVLGFTDDPTDPNHPDDPEVLIIDPTGHHPGLLFIPVPEDKATKNRLHLDLRPSGARDDTVEQVMALGGSLVADHRKPDGTGWVVLADPEGNELCVERSAAERPDSAVPADTGERPMPPFRAADERTMVAGLLGWYREGVLAKVAGLRDDHARAVVVHSGTSIIGLLKHLALVEDAWFARFRGEPFPAPWGSIDWDADPDWEWRTAREQPLAEVVELYEVAIARSRECAAAHELDEVAGDTSRPEFTLRFVLLHLLEETARHLGHIDVLREHLDGTTGD